MQDRDIMPFYDCCEEGLCALIDNVYRKPLDGYPPENQFYYLQKYVYKLLLVQQLLASFLKPVFVLMRFFRPCDHRKLVPVSYQ